MIDAVRQSRRGDGFLVSVRSDAGDERAVGKRWGTAWRPLRATRGEEIRRALIRPDSTSSRTGIDACTPTVRNDTTWVTSWPRFTSASVSTGFA